MTDQILNASNFHASVSTQKCSQIFGKHVKNKNTVFILEVSKIEKPAKYTNPPVLSAADCIFGILDLWHLKKTMRDVF